MTTLAQLQLRGRIDGTRGRPIERLVFVGDPPSAGIGYGFAPLVALLLRPRFVVNVGIKAQQEQDRRLWVFLLRSLVPCLAQLIVSGAVLPFQLAAAALIRRRRPVSVRRSTALQHVLYVRPLAGMAETVGGSVTHAHEVIRALGQCGVRVTAISTDDGIVETAEGESDLPPWHLVRVPWLFRALPASFAFAGDLALVWAALKTRPRPDAIYQRQTRFSLAGGMLAMLMRCPLILEYNSPSDFFRMGRKPPLTKLRDLYERASLASAARIVVVSEVARKQLAVHGIEPERIVVSSNGVDAERFASGGGEHVRKLLGLSQDNVLCGFAGSFGSWHGAPVLARAFARVAECCPSARLLMVGDGEELSIVRNALVHLTAERRVFFMGRVAPPHMPSMLDACDILVSPHVPLRDGTEFFGSPTKLYEYMAAGKAIIASALGQIAEVLEDGSTAILVDPGDEDELTAALVQLVNDAELRRKLGPAARKTAIAHHSWRQNARRIIRVYRELPTR